MAGNNGNGSMRALREKFEADLYAFIEETFADRSARGVPDPQKKADFMRRANELGMDKEAYHALVSRLRDRYNDCAEKAGG